MSINSRIVLLSHPSAIPRNDAHRQCWPPASRSRRSVRNAGQSSSPGPNSMPIGQALPVSTRTGTSTHLRIFRSLPILRRHAGAAGSHGMPGCAPAAGKLQWF